tara:strand:+ start:8458 stop:10539 length:2082 start_codon:yes stop_codon:yes gene_type:complete
MMLIYILKFSACLAIFLAFYNLFLEKENMHQFKRYYLLGILLISAIIPLITFTQYIEVQPIANDLRLAQLSSDDAIIGETENLIDYLPTILWSIYGIGVFLFGIKFGLNLTKMVNKIRNNPKQRSNSFINVLLKDIITPHTFFSYIFLNKHKYETHQIPQEVLLHEQTHAEQKHSIDVLFIELFQIIFWFNPLVHIIKNCIKLNHEFLADKAVINKGIEASSYQQILLAFSTNVKEPQLANAINYSSIKKRFTVMKTETSKQKRWFRSLILLPLLAFTLYSFSDKIEIIKGKNQLELLQQNNDNPIVDESSKIVVEKQDGASREQMKEYNRLAKHYNSMREKQRIIKQKDVERMEYIYNLMNDKQKKDAEPFPNIPPPPPAPNAPKVIEVEEVLPPPPPPVPANASPEQKAKYKKVIAEYAKKYPESVTRYKSKSGKTIEEVEVPTSMLPPPPPPPPIPENATPEQRKKYEEAIKNHKLAVAKSKQNLARVREVNDAERAKLIRVKEQYVAQRKASQEAKLARVAEMKQRQEKLRQEKKEYLVKRETLSKEQKAQLKKVKLRKVKEQKVEIEKRQEQLKKEKLKHVEERKVKAEEKRKHAMAMKLKRQEENIARQKMNIPPPPPPKSPLDHVVEMAKKDAIFYFEGKEISTDEAIKKLKQNKKINIRTYNKDSKKPKVYLSTKPIVVETKEKN